VRAFFVSILSDRRRHAGAAGHGIERSAHILLSAHLTQAAGDTDPDFLRRLRIADPT
jgi:hypothetical protein